MWLRRKRSSKPRVSRLLTSGSNARSLNMRSLPSSPTHRHSVSFPPVFLIGTAGLDGYAISNCLTGSSRFWAVGPSMLQILCDGGRRRAASQAAIANYDATVAGYRETTLTAFQQVEDNLAALR